MAENNSNIEKRHVWMPITKTEKGYAGILSDTSIDRDDEFMSKELLQKWTNQDFYFPILLDHDNKVMSNIGMWKEKSLVENDGHSALRVVPHFFESNPNTKAVKGMLDDGAQLGLSIGAIPRKSEEVEIDGKTFNKWTDAELVEGSFVPVASNRHSYVSIAKSFGISKPAQVEECVKTLVNDPEFKPKDGKTKEESAWAVCQAQHKKTPEENNLASKILIMTTEVNKMAEEETAPETPEEENKEVVEEEAPVETPEVETEAEAEPEKNVLAELRKEVDELKAKNVKLEETFKTRSATLKALKEDMPTKEEKQLDLDKVKPTIANMIAAQKGFDVMEE